MQKNVPAIQLDRVSFEASAGRKLLDDVSVEIGRGESVALIGRSGAGKTTLLRAINLLIRPSSGTVARDGIVLDESNAVAVRRQTGTILQSPALFPHRTVAQNIAAVPSLLGWSAQRTAEATRIILERLGLAFDRYAGRYPRSLSGGEQQRVGIARALVTDPPVVLCDEPFSALDPIARGEQQEALLTARNSGSSTIVFVTHDLSEAMRIAARLILIDDGRIVFDGDHDAFMTSTHPLVARFIAASRLAP